ncbi:hypothetical protein LTR09_012599 [Extremus antarcticus]|uniref:VOC domain-containing protein n=1 Tax=Extremus antarcticus TaxID=702011 RepID=A0AAJ0D4I4_9PEZI|nr:hypothetical protein LTR09_012599 [Extremus antarcticus]
MSRPNFIGINHLKFAAADILKTKNFYCSIMNFGYLADYDHRMPSGELFAVMLQLEHTTSSGATTPILVEIRHNEAQAKAQQGWDLVTIGVRTKDDLDACKSWFEANGVECSRVFTGPKGWVLAALDPDGKIVRVYCDEEHEWTTEFDEDDFWLR